MSEAIEKKDFTERFFRAAVRLYGVVELSALYDVYKEYCAKATVPELELGDFVAFSSETPKDSPYIILEADELYSDEPRTPEARVLVSTELLNGEDMLGEIYGIIRQQQGIPFCVPENMLDYAEPFENEQDRELHRYIGELRSTAKYLTSADGTQTFESKHSGKKLRYFSYIPFSDRQTLDALTAAGETEACERLKKVYDRPFGDILFDNVMFLLRTYRLDFEQSSEFMLANIEEVGVEPDLRMLNDLVERLENCYNACRSYVNRGWTTIELQKLFYGEKAVREAEEERSAEAEQYEDAASLVDKLKDYGFNVKMDNKYPN